MVRNENITKLTLASMLAAVTFICFAYLRIEVSMGGRNDWEDIYLSAFLFGAKYGGLTGAVGLSLADILAGYVTSAPPTFVANLY